jgi:predicted RNA-binding protein Jag
LLIEELYEQEEYNNYLVMLANKNMLEFDDFKQDVFLDIIDSRAHTEKQYSLIADKIAKRTKRKNMREYMVPMDELY